jgi:hypothetical protein
MRADVAEMPTSGLWEFLGREGLLYPFLRLAKGLPQLMADFHRADHGLLLMPFMLILGTALASLRWKKLRPAAIFTWSFAAALLPCAYVAVNSWAGARYATPFLPFIIGYGLYGVSQGAQSFLQSKSWHPSIPLGMAIAAIALLLIPVVNPHRYWFRIQSGLSRDAEALPQFIRALEAQVPAGQPFYAASLCQAAFASDRPCIGIQEWSGPEVAERLQKFYQPQWMALAPSDSANASVEILKRTLPELGWDAQPHGEAGGAQWWRLVPVP